MTLFDGDCVASTAQKLLIQWKWLASHIEFIIMVTLQNIQNTPVQSSITQIQAYNPRKTTKMLPKTLKTHFIVFHKIKTSLGKVEQIL